MKNPISKYPLLLVFFVYLLANGLMVVSPGVWWDDWTIFNPDIDVLRHQFVTGGQPHFAAFHIWVAQHIPMEYVPQFYHLISFVSGALCLWMAWFILKWFRLDRSWVIGIALLVASSPLFSARISMACIMYYTSAPLFLLGVVLFLRYVRGGGVGWRIGAFVAFLASLTVWLTAIALIPAFLVLMAVYVEPEPARWKWDYVRLVVRRLVGWLELLLLPVFAIIIRSLWMAPTEAYADSYSLELGKLVRVPLVLLKSFSDNTAGYLRQCFDVRADTSGSLAILIVIAGGLTMLVCRCLRSRPLENDSHYGGNRLLWIGLGLYFSANLATSSMSPALFDTFNSRYQALLLVPMALMLFWVILQFRTARQRRVVLGLLVGLGVMANIYTQLQFQKSWVKSCAIELIIRGEKQLQVPDTNVLVLDNCIEYNAYKGRQNYYVLTGISKMALQGDESHFYLDQELRYVYQPIFDIVSKEKYNCRNSTDLDTFHYRLILSPGQTPLDLPAVISLTVLYYLDRPAFEQSLSSVIDYQILPITDTIPWNR